MDEAQIRAAITALGEAATAMSTAGQAMAEAAEATQRAEAALAGKPVPSLYQGSVNTVTHLGGQGGQVTRMATEGGAWAEGGPNSVTVHHYDGPADADQA